MKLKIMPFVILIQYISVLPYLECQETLQCHLWVTWPFDNKATLIDYYKRLEPPIFKFTVFIVKLNIFYSISPSNNKFQK